MAVLMYKVWFRSKILAEVMVGKPYLGEGDNNLVRTRTMVTTIGIITEGMEILDDHIMVQLKKMEVVVVWEHHYLADMLSSKE